MSSRHRSRELAVQLTYQYTVSPQTLMDQRAMDRFWTEQAQTSPSARPFFEQLVRGVADNLPTLDRAIEVRLDNWRMDRLDRMDLAILRVAAFELLIQRTPKPVVINEALELAKKYCNQDSPSFINGILDNLDRNETKA